MSHIIKGIVLVFILASTQVNADRLTDIDVPEKYKEWGEKHKDIDITENIKTRVDAVVNHVASDEWKANQERYKREMKQMLGFENEPEQGDLGLPIKDRVVLFISESIPLHVLRTYAKDVAKVDGIMVLRGMKGGVSQLQPTVQLIGDIIKKDPACNGPKCEMLPTSVIIDPLLFRENEITKVPAAVFQANMDISSYCERRTEGDQPKKASHVVYGDASLVGLLRELYVLGNDRRVLPMIERLGG